MDSNIVSFVLCNLKESKNCSRAITSELCVALEFFSTKKVDNRGWEGMGFDKTSLAVLTDDLDASGRDLLYCFIALFPKIERFQSI